MCVAPATCVTAMSNFRTGAVKSAIPVAVTETRLLNMTATSDRGPAPRNAKAYPADDTDELPTAETLRISPPFVTSTISPEEITEELETTRIPLRRNPRLYSPAPATLTNEED